MNTFQNIVSQLDMAIVFIKANMTFVLAIIGLLYGIHLINFILGYRLNILGIYPRHPFGLFGVAFSPFLHGHFNHLFFNSIPLVILMSFVLLKGFDTFYCVSGIIILLGGLATWLFGRRGLHVGASGLIMGYWSYLLFNAYQEETVLSIGLGIVCIYYFGGLIFNLFPLEVKSSWEAHVFGFLAGLAAAYCYPMLTVILSTYF